MNASLRELNNKSSELARRAQNGETITITDRGRPIAQLAPHDGFRFAERDEVLAVFADAPVIDGGQLRAELDALADPDFADPYAR